ncbi:ABC transporter substrate-binding protein [Ensifer sp. 4252]|uniref:ABC transporter substrate-binding protein n=1 Tax=Ensifer sp. 4252 TaxID=3373915 RepID=UPI003D1EB135
MKMRSSIAIASLAALLAGGVTSPGMALEGTLRIRMNADIRSTDPGFNRDANTDAVVGHIVEGLVGYKDDASVAPLLAKTIHVSQDGLTYTFKLRDNVTFSNGEKLTSSDVLFAWQRYSAPENGWRCLPDVTGKGVAKVTSVSAPDASTIVFTLDKPSALFLTTLARPDCGQTGIYHRSSIGPDGKWIAPIGTGPFTLSEWRTGQFIELKANPSYSPIEGPVSGYVGNKQPRVETVRFVIVPDDSAAKAALFTGDLDVIPDVDNTDVADLKANETLDLQGRPGMGLTALLFQTKDPLLSDVRIRKALMLSLDLPQLADVVSGGQAKASSSVIPQPSPYFSKAQSQVPARDIAAAKALLAEAGYNGQPITWLTTEFYPQLFSAAVLVQAMVAEAGINIQIETLDWATLLDRYTAGRYTAMSFLYSARLDPSLSYDMVSGDKSAQPNKVWDNAQGRELMAQARVISDPAKRQPIFDRLEDMIRADVPLVVLYSGTRIIAVRKGVEGFAIWPLGLPRAWGVSVIEGK